MYTGPERRDPYLSGRDRRAQAAHYLTAAVAFAFVVIGAMIATLVIATMAFVVWYRF